MYCEMCGALNDDSAKICKKCGFSFDGEQKELDEKVKQEIEEENVKDKKIKKRNKTTTIVVALVAIIGIGAVSYFGLIYKESGFKQDGEYYVYYRDDYKLKDSFIEENGNTFRVDQDGHRIENASFRDNSGKSYFFDENGKMLKNIWKNGKYYTGNGVMLINDWSPDGIRVDENGDKLKDPITQILATDKRYGTLVRFGELEQNGNKGDGKEIIDWYLLYSDSEKAYLISKDILLNYPYQTSERLADNNNTSYDASYIKEQLNDYFYKSAFVDNDKKYIKDNGLIGKIYIPSKNDIDTYLPFELFRCSAPTKIASDSMKNSMTFTNLGTYWLRDDGKVAMHKMFVSDVGDIIDDDVSDNIVISNETYTEMVKEVVGQKAVETTVPGSGNGSGGDSLMDTYGRDIATGLAEYAIGAMFPGVGSIFAGLGGAIASKIFDKAVDGNNSNASKKITTYEDVYDYVPKLRERVVKKSEPNPYKDVGLITNQFNGVRPMITIDLSK